MKARRLNERDYDTLCEWAAKFRFPYPAKEFLPENGTGGIMVSKDGEDICAGFIYFTNSKIAWLEFVVSNFEYKNKDRKDAIQLLITELCGIAKRKGFGAVFTAVKHESLINHFKSCGFNKDANKSTEMTFLL